MEHAPAKTSKSKAVKKPKIIRFIPGKEGPLGSVIYDNGRVFLFTYTKAPNPLNHQNPGGEGYWSEMIYPDLSAYGAEDRPENA